MRRGLEVRRRAWEVRRMRGRGARVGSGIVEEREGVVMRAFSGGDIRVGGVNCGMEDWKSVIQRV